MIVFETRRGDFERVLRNNAADGGIITIIAFRGENWG